MLNVDAIVCIGFLGGAPVETSSCKLPCALPLPCPALTWLALLYPAVFFQPYTDPADRVLLQQTRVNAR